MEDPQSDFTFLSFFGHQTNIQNFYKIFIPKEKLFDNKHKIPEFAATLSWELYNVKYEEGSSELEIEIKLDGDYLDIKSCPNGICPVQQFLDYTEKILEGDTFEEFCHS